MRVFRQLNCLILGLIISLSYEIRTSSIRNINLRNLHVLRARQSLPTIDTSTLRECKNMNIIGGGGFNGRKASDFTFKPEDSKTFKQKESQNLGIICSAMCNDLKTVCKFKEKDEVVQNCNKIRDTIGTTRDKSKMDLWNSLFKVGGGVKNTTEAISTGKNITEASGTGKNITEASGTAKNITEASGTAKNITDNKETKEKKKP